MGISPVRSPSREPRVGVVIDSVGLRRRLRVLHPVVRLAVPPLPLHHSAFPMQLLIIALPFALVSTFTFLMVFRCPALSTLVGAPGLGARGAGLTIPTAVLHGPRDAGLTPRSLCCSGIGASLPLPLIVPGTLPALVRGWPVPIRPLHEETASGAGRTGEDQGGRQTATKGGEAV